MSTKLRVVDALSPAAEWHPGQPLPTIASVSPTHVELIARRDGLNRERADLLAEAANLQRESGRQASQAEVRLSLGAALLDGKPMDAATPAPTVVLAGIMKRVHEIDLMLDVLKRRIASERFKASAIIQAAVARGHREMVIAFCQKLSALHELNREYRAFANALNDDGVAWSILHPMHARFLGSPKDTSDAVGRFFREAVQFGFITWNDVPEDMRQ